MAPTLPRRGLLRICATRFVYHGQGRTKKERCTEVLDLRGATSENINKCLA